MDSFLPLLQQNTERTAQNRGLIKNNSFYFISLAAGLSTIAASIFRKIHANFYAVPTECHQFLPAAVAFAAVLIPEGAPGSRNVPESSNKKQPCTLCKAVFDTTSGQAPVPFLTNQAPQGPARYLVPAGASGGHELFSPPMAHQVLLSQRLDIRKKALRFRKAFLWCAIGDSNPGPTD